MATTPRLLRDLGCHASLSMRATICRNRGRVKSLIGSGLLGGCWIEETQKGAGRPVLKLRYAAVTRAAERWRGIAVGEFEQRQLRAIRDELGRASR
jgi:hypothetical protein